MTQERIKLSLDLKQEGNKAYSGKEFQEAIVFYSKAIQCDEQAVFYSNRAACTSYRMQCDTVIDHSRQVTRILDCWTRLSRTLRTLFDSILGI